MSDFDDGLEYELRSLLTRVLSVQMEALEKRSEDLSQQVLRLGKNSNEVLKQLRILSENLHERCDANAESLKGTLTEGSAALGLQMERLHGALAETRTAIRGHFRTKAERSALAVGRPGQM